MKVGNCLAYCSFLSGIPLFTSDLSKAKKTIKSYMRCIRYIWHSLYRRAKYSYYMIIRYILNTQAPIGNISGLCVVMWVMEVFSLLINSIGLFPPNNNVVHMFLKSFLSILSCKTEYYSPAIILNIHFTTTDIMVWIGKIFTWCATNR
jgi:hypothetical protein